MSAEGYSTYRIVHGITHGVPGSTASADIDWEKAWKAAAPVVVAAGRYLDAELDGTPALREDAHFQLLRAVTQYKSDTRETLAGGTE